MIYFREGVWKNAGTGANKQVIKVGDVGNETLLKHVAAGNVTDGSTDAVNGGQLYSVIESIQHLKTQLMKLLMLSTKE
ncbi:hypothetical protein [Histophilus somni]|uniref:hypothetical protein n=1 Tax=Histophilus somni TaxID=731 RepID=UPI0018EE4476|nr:hypothetical protein [Histophilus somni]QQF79512.1 hypothetical protein JFL53_04210 [Histophilus somni]